MRPLPGEPQTVPVPYAPPSLLPGMAGLCSALASRAALKDGALRFFFDPVTPVAPASGVASRFILEADGFPFRLEFAALDFLAAHEALRGLEIARLPEAVRLATIAMVLEPFRDALENALKITLVPVSAAETPVDWLHPPFRFALDFTSADDRTWAIPFSLSVAREEGAVWLMSRVLAALPQAWRNQERGNWPIAVSVLAGVMRLPLGLLEKLQLGDVLLPPDYPAAKGQAFLVLSEQAGFRLAISGDKATVLDRIDHFCEEKETRVNSEAQSPADGKTSPENPVADGSLEVTVHFELEKKLLPLSEIESLLPGKTFFLGTDPFSEVTVVLNGRTLASGRLVDLNGTLGVQITRLSSKPRHG